MSIFKTKPKYALPDDLKELLASKHEEERIQRLAIAKKSRELAKQKFPFMDKYYEMSTENSVSYDIGPGLVYYFDKDRWYINSEKHRNVGMSLEQALSLIEVL